jgi:hypothetical protein
MELQTFRLIRCIITDATTIGQRFEESLAIRTKGIHRQVAEMIAGRKLV